jgi:hypothetical protein
LIQLLDAGDLALPFRLASGTVTGHAFEARFRHAALMRPQVRRFRQWLASESEVTRGWLARNTGVATRV